MAQETWTTEVEKMSEQDSQRYCLTDLPSDVLVMILEYLPLFDLANVRLVGTAEAFHSRGYTGDSPSFFFFFFPGLFGAAADG